jgi:hypothetical protein
MFETAGLGSTLVIVCIILGYYVQKLTNDNRYNLLEIKELRDRVFKLEWQSEQDTEPALKGLQRQIDRLEELREQLLSLTQNIDRRLEKLEK